MNQQPSYCLDIRVGYSEQDRDELIGFLRQVGKFFGVGKAQRGMWQGAKILRVETPKAAELAQHIIKSLRLGDDYDYEVHETFTDANRCDTWLPDFDTAHGHERFDLIQPESTTTEQPA